MKRVFATVLVALVALISSFEAKAIKDPYQKSTMLAGVHFGILPGFGSTVYGDYVLVDSWWKGHFTVGGQIGLHLPEQDRYQMEHRRPAGARDLRLEPLEVLRGPCGRAARRGFQGSARL